MSSYGASNRADLEQRTIRDTSIPAKIINVFDIPKTKSGKIVESTIKNIVNNERIINLNSIANPKCLEEFRKKSQIIN